MPAGPEAQMRSAEAVLLRSASAAWERFRTPGAGEEWRVEDPELTGSALVCDDVLIHLQVFLKQEAGISRQPRPSIHRRYLGRD